MGGKNSSQMGGIGQAIRFQVSLPIRFRIYGEKVWREGWTVSMSLKEILFSTSREVEAGTGLEIRISLPSPQFGTHGGTITSKAQVLRCFDMPESAGRTLIIASISNTRLLHHTKGSGKG